MSFDSPPLPTAEIISFLRDSIPDVGLNEQDFKSPQMDRWQHIFMSLVCHITGCNPDNVHQPTMAAHQELEYPDLHETEVPLLNLAIALMRIGQACGIEISLIDIIKPAPKRLNKICSAMINFMRLQTDRLDAYDRIKQEDNVLREHVDALVKENDDLQQKINNIMASKAEQEPQTKQLEERIEVLQHELTDMKKSASLCDRQTVEVKSKISEKKAGNARHSEKIAEIRQDEARIDGQIVASPERMKSEMIALHHDTDKLRAERDNHMQRLMELNAKTDCMQAVDANCDDALRLINTIREKLDKEKSVKASIRKVQDEGVGVVQERIPTFISREQQLRRQLSAREDRLGKIQMQQSSKSTNMLQTLEDVKEEKEALLTKKGKKDIEHHELLEACQELQKGASVKQQQHEQRMAELREKFATMKETLDEYHMNLAESWDKVRHARPT